MFEMFYTNVLKSTIPSIKHKLNISPPLYLQILKQKPFFSLKRLNLFHPSKAMHKSLNIYPSMVILQYMSFNEAFLTQGLCKSQRDFIQKKLFYTHKDRSVLVDLGQVSDSTIDNSGILNLINYLNIYVTEEC